MIKDNLYYISIVITGKNAATTIRECLLSLQNLNYPKNRFEVIFVDGGSTDSTIEIVKEFINKLPRLEIFDVTGPPSSGRNKGIKKAQGDIIAFTDADCIVHPYWLTNIAKHASGFTEQVVGIGGPSLTPENDTYFSKCVGWLFDTLFGSAGMRNPATFKGIQEIDHNPTCNTAFPSWIFQKVGYFDDRLPVAEDLDFDRRIRAHGYRLLYADDVIVWHHRKPTLSQFARQMYNYGFWRAQIGKIYHDLLKPIHIIPALIVTYTLFAPIWLWFFGFFAGLPLLLYFIISIMAGTFMWIREHDAKLIFIIPAVGVVEHTCYGLGFITGMLKKPFKEPKKQVMNQEFIKQK